MSGFIQMPDGHPGALGSATAEKAQANYTAAPVIACACRSLRVHAPARGSPPRERASRAACCASASGLEGPRTLLRGAGAVSVRACLHGCRVRAEGERAENSPATANWRLSSSDVWTVFGIMRHSPSTRKRSASANGPRRSSGRVLDRNS